METFGKLKKEEHPEPTEVIAGQNLKLNTQEERKQIAKERYTAGSKQVSEFGTKLNIYQRSASARIINADILPAV